MTHTTFVPNSLCIWKRVSIVKRAYRQQRCWESNYVATLLVLTSWRQQSFLNFGWPIHFGGMYLPCIYYGTVFHSTTNEWQKTNIFVIFIRLACTNIMLLLITQVILLWWYVCPFEGPKDRCELSLIPMQRGLLCATINFYKIELLYLLF